MNKNKVIYLGTTYKCSACKCQENLLQQLIENREDVKLIVCNYTELPKWIIINVTLTDFPVTVFVENDVIKYHFVGTKSVKKMNVIIDDINF